MAKATASSTASRGTELANTPSDTQSVSRPAGTPPFCVTQPDHGHSHPTNHRDTPSPPNQDRAAPATKDQLRLSGIASMYEIFNRLNTGGINLTPQEIRASLYHSRFYDMLFRTNMDTRWRALVGPREPDLHMRDIEVLLRAVAMWRFGNSYAPSMVKFLNRFSKEAQAYDQDEIEAVHQTLEWFMDATSSLPRSVFLSRQSKFMVTLFEAVFASACQLHDQGSIEQIYLALRTWPDLVIRQLLAVKWWL